MITKQEEQDRKDEEAKQKAAMQARKLAEIQERGMTASNGSIFFEPSLSMGQKINIMTCNCGSLLRLEKIRSDALIFRCANYDCRLERALPKDHTYFREKI